MSYPGVDELKAMSVARRYNDHILDGLATTLAGRERILDFGAGIGTFAKGLTTRGFRVDCLEIDSGQAEYLRGDGFVVHESLETCASGYDGIYAINVIEHIEDDIGALRRLAREHMAPGARLVVYVPAFELLYSSNDALVGHVRRYTRAGLERSVRLAGFQEIESRYVDSLGVAAALSFKAFGADSGHITARQVSIYDRLLFPLSVGLDRFFSAHFGKNLWLSATRP